eukprot:783819_1
MAASKPKTKLDMKPFPSHMTLEDAMKLSANDTIDHRDSVGRFAIATVSEKNGLKLKIHYNGWGPQYDTWSDVSVELHRFASAGSISSRPSHHRQFNELKKGDSVDINPLHSHAGWKVGEILRLDAKSGQVCVAYEYFDTLSIKTHLYWTHLDNADEIALLHTKTDRPKAKHTPPNVRKPDGYNQNSVALLPKLPKIKTEDRYTVFVPHMSVEDAYVLSVHAKIDHRDHVGRFLPATVEQKQGSNLRIHYDGWSRKWDVWSDFNAELHRFASAGSISSRPSHHRQFNELKKGDSVDINPLHSHAGWKVGEILRLDAKSGQVCVAYEYFDTLSIKTHLYWTHLDNADEIALLHTKTDRPKAKHTPPNVRKPDGYNQNSVALLPKLPKIKTEDRYTVFVPHMSVEDAYVLSVHAKIDHRDHVGRFLPATVEQKQGSNLRIHYDGWARKWDIWSDFTVELYRFAAAGSISLRRSHRVQFRGDSVDINPLHSQGPMSHAGWKEGEIRSLDPKSGQVLVAYEYLDKTHLYWTHLDNSDEIALFHTKTAPVDRPNTRTLAVRKPDKINQQTPRSKPQKTDVRKLTEANTKKEVPKQWYKGTEMLTRKWTKKDEIEYDSDPQHNAEDNKSHVHKGIILKVIPDQGSGKILIKDDTGGYGNYGLETISIKLPPTSQNTVERAKTSSNKASTDVSDASLTEEQRALIGGILSLGIIDKLGFSIATASNKAILLKVLQQVEPKGQTALRDAIVSSIAKMITLKSILDEIGAIGHQFIHIVLSDGADNRSKCTFKDMQELYSKLGSTNGDQYFKTYFIGISLGSTAKRELQSIANLAGDAAELHNCDEVELSDVFDRIKLSLGVERRVALVTDGSMFAAATSDRVYLQVQRQKFLVLFDLDMSGSMSGGRWRSLRAALSSFFDGLDDSDIIGCVLFNHEATCITGEVLSSGFK